MSKPDASAQSLRVTPDLRWMMRSPVRFVAFGFGSGLLRPAPGTWGTLAGWLIWALALHRMPDASLAVLIAVSFVAGCWVCHRTGRELGIPDYGGIVWDEIVAIWIVLWVSPASWAGQVAAVALFRFFDILKPPPVRYFDRLWANGFGVMWDDIVAAAYSLLAMAVLVRLDWIAR